MTEEEGVGYYSSRKYRQESFSNDKDPASTNLSFIPLTRKLLAVPFLSRSYKSIMFLFLGLAFCFIANKINIRTMDTGSDVIMKLSKKDSSALHSVFLGFVYSVVFFTLREVYGVCFTFFINNVLSELSHGIFKNSLYSSSYISSIRLNRVIDRGIKSITLVLEKILITIISRSIAMMLIFIELLRLMDNLFFLVLFYNVLYVIITYYLLRQRILYKAILNKWDDAFSSKQVESLDNLNVVRFCNQEKFELDLFSYFVKRYLNIKLKDRLIIMVLHIGQGLIYGLLILNVLLALYYDDFVSEKVKVAVFLMMLIRQLDVKVMEIAIAIKDICICYVDCHSFFILNDCLSSTSSTTALAKNITQTVMADDTPPPVGQEPFSLLILEFRNVSFSFDKNRPNILNNFSCKINKGEKVAIMGRNGCGKSTLLFLLTKKYSFIGSIFYKGANISTLTKDQLVNEIAIVQHDGGLFNQTIEYNLKYGCNNNISKDHFDQIISIFAIDKIASSKHEGFRYLVGEAGCNLSAGERQRISIARMLLRDPDVLILDESVSKIDHELVNTILDYLILNIPTLILITHSQRIADRMDRIISLDPLS